MAKGKILGFLGKVGSLIGNVIPGAGVAGKLAENAGKLMKDKSAQAALKKSREQQVAKETAIAGAYLTGGSPFVARLGEWFRNAWDFTKKNWYIVLPAVLAIIWVLFFSKKTRPRRRSYSRPRALPVRHKKSARPRGSAWARKMLLARRRKARARK